MRSVCTCKSTLWATGEREREDYILREKKTCGHRLYKNQYIHVEGTLEGI